MKPDEYWKNFSLGTELDIAGRFIYNALQTFHQMEHFRSEEDAFEFLYALSVGIERLLKIALILTEHDKQTDQTKFEQELITHNHQILLGRLQRHHNLNLGAVHHDLIAVLSRFYKSHRYGRYSLRSVAAHAQERDDLIKFLEKYLKISIDIESMFGITRNERRHRKFIGKVVGKIVAPVFEIIRNEAYRLNIYTYEIESGSKADKILQQQAFDFESEDILHAELLAYFVSRKSKGPNAKFLRQHAVPVAFDPALEADYIAALRSDPKKLAVLDELDTLYQHGVPAFKSRRDMLDAAVSHYLGYGDEEEGIMSRLLHMMQDKGRRWREAWGAKFPPNR